MNNVLTIILGGGRGTRLYPLTKYRSKPAVPIGGKYRLIDIPLSNCVHSGLYKVYVLTQFMSVSLNRHISNAYSFDHLRSGFVEVIPASQGNETGDEWFMGTADAVRKSLVHYRQHTFTDYVILSGDHLYRMDYRHLVKVHRRRRADFTVATIPVTKDKISELGIMKINQDYRITDFVEKPKDEQLVRDFKVSWNDQYVQQDNYLASMGIYIFRREVLEHLLNNLPGYDFGKEIVPQSIGTHYANAFVYKGYWEDIGMIRDYFNANINITDDNPQFTFYDPAQPIFSRPRQLPASILDKAKINKSLICEGCNIKNAQISKSVIGIRSKIAENTFLNTTLMMGADYYAGEEFYPDMQNSNLPSIGVGTDCEIHNTIIDKNARIGNGVKILPKEPDVNIDGKGWVVRDGITVIEKNAVILDGTII